MKTSVATALLFFCSSQAYSQTKQCFSYNYLKAEKKVWSYLFRGDNFEYLSDDISGHEVFNTKRELAHKGTFIPIPVLHLDISRATANDDISQLSSLFETDYSTFTGLLLNQEQLASLIISGANQRPNSKRIKNMGSSDSAMAIIVYDLFKSKKICFFYDKPRFRYAYFENNNYIYYDIEKKSMITLSASECVADYNRYFSLK